MQIQELSQKTIYYSKTKIARKTVPGILMIFAGLATLLGVLNIDRIHEFFLDDTLNLRRILLFSMLAFMFPLLGTLIVVRNLFRIVSKKPQLEFDENGIFVSLYKVMGKINWTDITNIYREKRPSQISFSSLDCIVLSMKDKKTNTTFFHEVEIKLNYLDCDGNDLLKVLKSYWVEANSIQQHQENTATIGE